MNINRIVCVLQCFFLFVFSKIYQTQYLAMTQRMNSGNNRIYDPNRFNCNPYYPTGCGCLIEVNRLLTLQTFNSTAKCRGLAISKIVNNHVEVDYELKRKLQTMKANCLPRPHEGCRCVEHRKDGRTIRKIYQNDGECSIS
ncbi:hypothetical protein M3Y96_00460900 [Aphelenchoides besseyi]|nr:hypothetical protein M3Y96_00460900 [Aphelenchoides besseyi]